VALANGGCLWVAAGAAAGGAAAGYAYYRGRVYRDYPASLPDSLAAVRDGLTELRFPILGEEHDGDKGWTIHSHTGDGSRVTIDLESQPSPIPAEGPKTRISVRVSTFGDEVVSVRILDQIGLHLGPPRLTPQPIPNAPQPPPLHETTAPPLAVDPARPR
jgi:hypothetical protein